MVFFSHLLCCLLLFYFLYNLFPGLTPARKSSVVLPTVDTFRVYLVNVTYLCTFTTYLFVCVGA